MAHTAADMLQPGGGDLTASLFPALLPADLTTFLAAKLTEGYARANAAVPALSPADLDGAAIAWAYSRAYQAIWQRLSGSPAVVGVSGEAQRTYLASQIQTFRDLSQEYLARHEQYFPLATGEGSTNAIVSGVTTYHRY